MTACLPDNVRPKSRYRVAFISQNPSQWQGPLFARLAATPAIQPQVYYLSAVGLGVEREAEMGAAPDWGSLPVLEGYDHVFVEDSLRGGLKLIGQLITHRYDAIVLEGYRQLPLSLSLLYTILARTPRFLRIDSILMYEQDKPNWKRKQRLFPILRRGFTAFLPLSSLAVQYLQHLGVPSDRIFMVPYTVDNLWYARLAEEWRPRREVVRAELGLPQAMPVVVAVLRFVERERPLDLLKAISVLQEQSVPVGAILVGDGPQYAELVDYIRTHDLRNVVLPGFRPLPELPKYYAAADMFVHPAVEECWGLSVNEAMACGLPVIVSDRVGAAYDLIEDGRTGVTYRAGDIDQLAGCIGQLCKDEGQRQMMGSRSRDFIFTRWNYERSISALQSALARFADQRRTADSV
jgi:glycosyltransferase involved in cell wall biosynthesis